MFGAINAYMSSLAPTSVLGLAGMLYTAVVVALRYAQGAYASGGRFVAQLAKDGQKLPSFGTGRSPGGALLLVSMLATSFIAHYNAANGARKGGLHICPSTRV